MKRSTARKIMFYCVIGIVVTMLVSCMVSEAVANYVILPVPVLLIVIGIVSLLYRCPACGRTLKLYGMKECPKCGMKIDED